MSLLPDYRSSSGGSSGYGVCDCKHGTECKNLETGGESDDDWRTLRRAAWIWDRRGKVDVIKGFTQQKEGRAPTPKHVIVEDSGWPGSPGPFSSLEVRGIEIPTRKHGTLISTPFLGLSLPFWGSKNSKV